MGYDIPASLLAAVTRCLCAVAWGANSSGQCNVPPLDEGVSYTDVIANGSAVGLGSNSHGQCNIPPLGPQLSYTQAAGGNHHTVLLRSDGKAVAFGSNRRGFHHTVLLRSDGCAVACGQNIFGECNIPRLHEGIKHTQIAAGFEYTVLLRSDGRAAACGHISQESLYVIPPLEQGIVYTHVSAGYEHAVLVRSDGRVVVCGPKRMGRCGIPFPEPGHWYVAEERTEARHSILHLDCICEHDEAVLTCCNLAGDEKVRLNARGMNPVWDICKRVACKLNVSICQTNFCKRWRRQCATNRCECTTALRHQKTSGCGFLTAATLPWQRLASGSNGCVRDLLCWASPSPDTWHRKNV
eukprot:s2845_g13.t1